MRQTGILSLVGVRAVTLGLLTAVIGSCAKIHESPDFVRHRYSQLFRPSERNDVLYFDVMFDANYPDGDPAAEAMRMEWLEDWLEQRKMCQDGYEIVRRRPFDASENNPAQYDIRYEVKCTVHS